jgi:subtilisin family serine protease
MMPTIRFLARLATPIVTMALAAASPGAVLHGRPEGRITSRRWSSPLLAVVLLALLWPVPAVGAPASHVPDELLVKFRAGTGPAHGAALHAAAGAIPMRTFATVRDLHLVKLPPGLSTAQAIARYRRSPDVLYVEPNRVLRLQATPNDPSFTSGDLWGLDSIPITDDADIDAPEAWDLTVGSPTVVVAVIDSGIDYAHEDLAANMFRNEADCNDNGVDDDGNGFVDDCYGIDPISGDSDPMDDNAHGTHVAGTIGAVGNNGIGVVGVNWRVKLLACKIFDADGYGTVAAAIACLDYVAMMKDRGVNIIATNNSWRLEEFSQSLLDAIETHRQRGILLVAAAGNYQVCYPCRTDTDNDRKPTWPASFYLPNVIGVSNSQRFGFLNAASAYGRRTMHVAAPGTDILSTTPGNTYDVFTGTSMAAPHVTGLAALLKAQAPGRDWKAIKNLILAGADGDMWPDDEHVITRKRLNAHGSLACTNATLVSRLRPIRSVLHTVVGRPMELAALHIRCAAPNGNVTVTVAPGGQTVTLRDDGLGPDQEAGDGIYSGQWTPGAEGEFTLTFPDADVVTVRVLAGAYTVTPVPFADREITGTRIGFIPTEPTAITSPFPILFGGGSFTTLFVDERGTIQFDGGGFNADMAFFNEPLPSPFHSTLVAPFWDDIGPAAANVADVLWAVIGTAPNRELVVEWRNVERIDRFCALFEGYISFQVVFFEASSNILFNYRDTTFGGECPDADGGAQATVGIQMGPDVATQWSFDAPSLADGTSLLWTLGQAPQPAIGVTPASRDFGNVAVGGSADAFFVVENTGAGTLTGQATTVAPFSIVAGGAYSLAARQTQVVTVRFGPTAAQTFAGTVSFTGGGGASRTVTGVGVGVGPSITSFSPAAGAPGVSVVIQGTNFTGATAVKLNGTSATFTVNTSTQIMATVPANTTTGPISVTTAAGTATSATSFTVAPRITGFTPASGAVGSSVVISGVNFTDAADVMFNGTATRFTIDSAVSITATVPAGATSGKISVMTAAGTATSAANFSVVSSIATFSPTSGAPGTSVTVTGGTFTGATAVKFNGLAATFAVNSPTQITATVPANATTGPISVTTPAGTATSATSFTVAPRITGFTPVSGAVGASVAINGANFTGATAIKFNGASAAFTVNSAIKITATVPAGATSGAISVTTTAGTVTSTTNFSMASQIAAFSPTSGAPGTSVTITGANFTGATSVKFNGVSATFTVNSSTQITTTVPANATTGPISVTTPAGTATTATSFTVAARITGFTPVSGTVGASVVINGANFTGATAVHFNGTSAAFTVNSAIKITATVPAGASSGKISVTTPAGSTTSAASFSVSPRITTFSPTSGAPGTSVTVTGTTFTGATAVKFNGASVTFTVNSSTQITATVPANATTGPISVTTPGGTATSAASFTVAPRITGFTPASGAVGASVVINGANFTGATAVNFNGTSAAFTVNSAIKITATVPAGATSGTISVTTPAGTALSSGSFSVM